MILQYFRFPNGNPEWGIRFPIDFPLLFGILCFCRQYFGPQSERETDLYFTPSLKKLMMFRQLASTGEPTLTKFKVFQCEAAKDKAFTGFLIFPLSQC